MRRKLMRTLIALLVVCAIATAFVAIDVTAEDKGGNIVTEIDHETAQRVMSVSEQTEHGGPVSKSPKAPCTLTRTNGNLQSYWDAYSRGSRTVIYFDPTVCGPAYPFQLTSVSFPLYDPGGYQWPVDLDVVVYDVSFGGDPCDGPGLELYRFSITCEEAFWSWPQQGIADFPEPFCVNGPVYVGIEYTHQDAGPLPSLLFDDSTTTACEVWQYEGGWLEWNDQWTPPVPGYPLFFVYGETESGACAADLFINELVYEPGPVGGLVSHEFDHEMIELYNSSAMSIDLSSWVISNRDGSASISLPSWTLPPGCFITIHQDTGTVDNDFEDLLGHYYTGDTLDIFNDDEDECALYDGTPGVATIRDFISWSRNSTYTPGAAHDYAVAAGIWTDGEYFENVFMEPAFSLTRYFDGLDRDLPSDWHSVPWWYYLTYLSPRGENSIQELPRHLEAIADATPTFEWSDFPDADSFQLQVDDDWSFATPEVNADGLTGTAYTPAVALPDEIYFHRLRAFVSGQPTSWSSIRMTEINTSVLQGKGESGGKACPHFYQRKDTKLLCLWSDVYGSQTRPGCPETGSCAWDSPHPNQSPATSGCRHGRNYCWAASTAMVTNALGGNISQDRLAYQNWHSQRPQPEGDLGHDRPNTGPKIESIIEWSLNVGNAPYTSDFVNGLSFNQIKAWIDARDFLVGGIPGHCVVLDDYSETVLADGRITRTVIVQDPWSGPNTRYLQEVVIPGAPARIVRPRRCIVAAWPHDVPVTSPRSDEASVSHDHDSDGIMCFDEGYPGYPYTDDSNSPEYDNNRPRKLCSHYNDKDTDDDEVEDKPEIKNYTFHEFWIRSSLPPYWLLGGYHPTHDNDDLGFPDVDGDDLRAECDCDSDGKRATGPNDTNLRGDFDGGEDINGDGENPVPSGDDCDIARAGYETCQFMKEESCIMVHTDRDSYLLGESVYIVDWHGSRETHTYHSNSWYPFELGGGCPEKPDSSYLAWNGVMVTDTFGHALPAYVMTCTYPGQYYLYVDVLRDHRYFTPDNWDPYTCWTCDEDWFHGWHWCYDLTYHNPALEWPTYDYPLIFRLGTEKNSDLHLETKQQVTNPEREIEPLKLPETITSRVSNSAKRLPECELLSYYGGVYYYWPVPNSNGDDYYNQRFTPVRSCTLTTAYLMFYEGGSTVTTGSGIDVVVWDDDGYGLPGTELARLNVPAEDIQFFPNWTIVDFSEYNLILSGDFHIGFTTVDQTSDVFAIVSDDGSYPYWRSSYLRYGEIWWFCGDDGLDINFAIQSEVCYETFPGIEMVIYVPWWWWCYYWPPPIRDIWLGVSIPISLYELGDVSITVPPAFSEPTAKSKVRDVSFVHSAVVEADLNAQFGDGENYWVGYSIPSWEIPDSLMSTMVQLTVADNKAVGDFYTAIRLGDSEYGWSPTFYDSLLIQPAGPSYVCGDADASGAVDIDDIVYLIAYIFSGGPAPNPIDAGDPDCSGATDIDDVVYLISYVFAGGPDPCCP